MNFVIAIPLDKELADFVGKGNDEGSIIFHNRKMESNVIVGLAPSSITDKFYAVAEIMLIADQIVVSTATIDKLFGEMLVACALTKKHVIFTGENDVSAFISAAGLSNYEISPREELLERVLKAKPNDQGSVRVDIDNAFPVKGIGSVALGVVTRGTLKVHDALYHSSGKLIDVKSIQSQDVDVQSAGQGTRVGVALKGVEHSDVEKGDILTKEKITKTNAISATLSVSKLSKEEVAAGKRYMLAANFSRSIATIESFDGQTATMKIEKPIPILKGDSFLLMREEAPRIFALGVVL